MSTAFSAHLLIHHFTLSKQNHFVTMSSQQIKSHSNTCPVAGYASQRPSPQLGWHSEAMGLHWFTLSLSIPLACTYPPHTRKREARGRVATRKTTDFLCSSMTHMPFGLHSDLLHNLMSPRLVSCLDVTLSLLLELFTSIHAHIT